MYYIYIYVYRITPHTTHQVEKPSMVQNASTSVFWGMDLATVLLQTKYDAFSKTCSETKYGRFKSLSQHIWNFSDDPLVSSPLAPAFWGDESVRPRGAEDVQLLPVRAHSSLSTHRRPRRGPFDRALLHAL